MVLFLLATISSPSTFPPRLWGENTKPQNISYLRQNKVLKCARCNNLQCLPVIPNYWNKLCFSPATYMPSCYRMVPAPHQAGWCRVQCQLPLAELCLHYFLLTSDSVGTQYLGWSPGSFHMWLFFKENLVKPCSKSCQPTDHKHLKAIDAPIDSYESRRLCFP